jgi:hypothetical protein
MLRAQAFEGLFTLVPILLVAVVSILLRARATRRRRRREEAIREADGQEVPAQRTSAGSPSGSAAVRGTPVREAPSRAARQGAPIREMRAPPITQSRREPAAAGPQTVNRESYVYPPPLQLNGLEATAIPAAAAPKDSRVPRPPARPVVQPGAAIERMTAPRPRESLRERMENRSKRKRPAAGARKDTSITGRLERLPPLKRAVVWAEILGPPGGQQ